ncbi:adenylate/guanylate cyclase domain-containing protein [Bradyrhizobium frederickii]|uniref:Adenylate/guanylate cyclase domain-containing protein n=1 Tax=Bradyrhizobium frederickii TaxID=2560054 RepID=A0A4Y9KUR2_9BRAD|nr:adenylate/guanylate cyclase domain-containing protein [Bradyrhizobium frederickii]TFV35070.1 adenylate/guanylate cyclase domain-containing protein [Bradyrhizobium frederickii]
MTSIDEWLLESKMTQIEQARAWSPRVISKFETLMRSGDEVSLYRANPLAFARDRNVAEPESIDLFLHAARAGLLDMHWDILCPHSGLVLESFGRLRALRSHFVCGLCDIEGQTDLDDFIEVSFSVSPQVRRLALYDVDNLSIEDLHWKLKFANSGRLPGGQIRFVDLLRSLVRGMSYLPTGLTTLHAEIGPGALSGVNVQTQAGFMLPVMLASSAEQSPNIPRIVRIAYDGQRFTPAVSAVPSGPVIFEINNTSPRRGSLLLINWSPEILAMPEKPTLEFDPYVSGGMLLTRQTFRKLFRSERVDEEEGLGVRQVTFLFTDLKGSTALYERLGDLNAYALVREHFALLDAIAQRHAGAIVKTIGDAVMAAFSRPVDAVAAALHILQDIGRFNREHGQPAIILKMGAHCGPSIAVTLNENLDYFGQTVNIAARVQSFADAGEVCLTEALYTAPAVRELLAGYDVEEFDAPLRGVEGEARVYRVTGRS